jgi:DNA-cytosine methyltransferase
MIELLNKPDSIISQVKDKWLGLDMFCGAGGVTAGINKSRVAQIAVAINHDKLAIKNHAANHPETIHFTYDITKIDLEALEEFVGLDFIWMSAECTNFSIAAGGKARNADSRMLPEQLFRYADYLKPKYLFIENVKEFLRWGPVDENGFEIPERRGEYYHRWVKTLQGLGWVNYEYKILNSADYGIPTNRKRYFAVFSQEHCPIIWPQQTHERYGDFGLSKWVSCKDFINLADEGRSIFGRKKPFSDNTLRRIAYGIQKYCINQSQTNFILKYHGADNSFSDTNRPLDTISTIDGHALVTVEKNLIQFITQHLHYSPNAQLPIDPLNTIIVKDMKKLVTLELSSDFNQPNNDVNKVEKLQFITKYFSALNSSQSLFEPLGTILTSGQHHALTTAEFLNLLIINIKTRFLNSFELKLCQGFDYDYILEGSEKDKKKFIGNSVTPIIPKLLLEANHAGYYAQIEKVA